MPYCTHIAQLFPFPAKSFTQASMKIIDLTHTIHEDIPVYPGLPAPELVVAASHEEYGFEERALNFLSHTGTHLDTPRHILPEGKSLSELGADHFLGLCCVMDVRGKKVIEKADLEQYTDKLHQCDYAILRTGWEEKWGDGEYFKDFPVLSEDAAKWLTGFWLKGLGVDAISVDPVDSTTFDVHRILLGADMVIVENLTNLDKLPERGFLLNVLPLKLKDGDGSPIRAVGIVCKGCTC